ncbi:MAG TPA: ATP-binding protein, partial [Burkholderiales bacterium]|nr:ATP-binding protein [Burkholderiales bacterium]
VSHDLRRPLRHIQSFATLLDQRYRASLDAGGQRFVHQITEAVRRMGGLIDGLLEFARSGQGRLSISPVDLDALVRDVQRELEPQAAGRHIEWSIGTLPTVSGDPALLRVVFVNLLDNALKYTGRCEQATIEIMPVQGAADEAIVCVRDNGVGFDPERASELFVMFQRLHSDHEFHGTGVGLASVQQIVRRHGGRVWAESVAGEGASFFVALPATATAAIAS